MPAKPNSKAKVDVAEHRATGVVYTAIEGAPGAFFTCEAYRARLSTTACVARWRQAQRARGEAADQFARCRGCPIGAQHAGERHFARSAIYASERCPRCGSGATRMIGGRLCVSCYNREFEFRRGKNAKGTRPTIFLAERRVGVVMDFDKPEESWRVDVVGELAVDVVEIMAAILRVAIGKIAFMAPGHSSVAVSMQEFSKLMASRLPAKPTWRRRRLLGAARGRRPS